jgi:alpha-glucosidase (family GH31 glycosyl hydrolase)
LHSLYGSQLATSFAETLYPHRVLGHLSFVLSESTFAGLGRTGAAHLVPPTSSSPSFATLKQSLASLSHMNLYGIPNSGLSLCPPSPDESLCAHSFALSVISPLAIYSANATTLDSHPFNFKSSSVKQAIVDSLAMRQRLGMYAREQMKRVESEGGVLIRPVFSAF